MNGKLYLRQRSVVVAVSDSRKQTLQERSPWYALLLAIIPRDDMSVADVLESMDLRVKEG